MGCGCLLALIAAVSPRFATFLLWVFTDRLTIVFNSFWIGFLGWIFLPWTTLAWAIAYAPIAGVRGFGYFLVVFAFIVDLSTHFGAAKARSARAQAAY